MPGLKEGLLGKEILPRNITALAPYTTVLARIRQTKEISFAKLKPRDFGPND